MTPPFKTHNLLDHPALKHGFFGRQGGVSIGPYDSLNAGALSGDSPAKVSQNLERIAQTLSATPKNLLSLAQIHSAEVLTLTEPFETSPKADGMVTQTKGLALSILTADCGPLLLADTDAYVIGACHAGWRGAVSGVVQQTIKAMTELGADVDRIHAVLGPCISQDNYEVGHEFRDSFVAEEERHDAFFRRGDKGKPHFDLKGFIEDQARRAGVTKIAVLPDCTYALKDEYFSYRRNAHESIKGYGRNLSAIMLR